MKKYIAFLLSLALLSSLAACGSTGGQSDTTVGPTGAPSSSQTEQPSPTPEPEIATPVERSGKTLVVYFSMPETTDPDNMTAEEDNSTVVIDGEVLGNTQYMAYVIQETLGADLFRIEPEVPYPTDHAPLIDQAREEQTRADRPAIKDILENPEDYSVIYLGYPNWWGDMPMILYTFLEQYDLSGKTIVPFNTHGGSGFSNTVSTIAELQPNATVSQDGLSISRNHIQDAEQEIIDWVQDIQANIEPSLPVEATRLSFSAGDTEIIAELNDLPLAQEIVEALPVTLTMTRLYEREYYGTQLDWQPDSTYETQIECTPGTLAYWPGGNSLVLIFGYNEEHPAIDSGIVVIGDIQTDLSAFDQLGTTEEMTVSIAG